jgi:CRP-like cAMP-binding protein
LKAADTRKLKTEAAAAQSKGNYRKALTLYEELCTGEPNDPLGPHRAGELFHRLGKPSDAIRRLRQAAELYARQGFLVKAIAVCKLILQVDPSHKETQSELSALYARKQETGPPPAPAEPPAQPAAPRKPEVEAIPIATDDAGHPSGFEGQTHMPGVVLEEPEGAPLAAAPEASQAEEPLAVDLPDPLELAALGIQTAPPPTPAPSTSPSPAAAAVSQPLRKRSASEIRGAIPRIAPERPPPAPAAPPPAPRPAPPPAAAATPPPTAAPPPPPIELVAPAAAPVIDLAAPLSAVSLGELAGARPFRGPEAGAAADALEIAIDLEPALAIEEETSEAAPERALPRTPLFSALDEPALRALIEKLDYQTFAQGQVLAKQGDVGDSLFVLASGEVAVVHEGPPPRELTRLGEGAFVGEIAMIADVPRTATIVATQQTEVLRLSRAVVWELSRRYPEFLSVLLRFLRDRLIDTLQGTSPLFLSVPPSDRKDLAGRFKLLEVEADRVLVQQGERSPALFILLAGKLAVEGRQPDGSARAVAELGPGAIVGELSLLTRQPAQASVRTAARCWLLSMGRETFSEVLMTYPTVLEYVNELAESRRQAVERLQLL